MLKISIQSQGKKFLGENVKTFKFLVCDSEVSANSSSALKAFI